MKTKNTWHTVYMLLACLTFCSLTAEEDYQYLDVSLKDTGAFPGDVSLIPEEVYLALKYLNYQDNLKILEFGAGESTRLLTNLLKDKQVPYDYHAVENDPAYVKDIDGVAYYVYDLPDIHCNSWGETVKKIDLPSFPIFDLVIVDGPHGVSRSEWYAKFKKYTRPGTVILIDDFHHYGEFGQALDKHFKYTTVIEYNQSPNWKIINEGLEPFATTDVPKTFKIVVVTEPILEE